MAFAVLLRELPVGLALLGEIRGRALQSLDEGVRLAPGGRAVDRHQRFILVPSADI